MSDTNQAAYDDQSLLGQAADGIPTPALVVDADLLEQNLARMADYFSSRPCCLRPHFKSHKCVELSRRQLAAGNASGITCAKLSEAEQLVRGGIQDVLIANQVVGATKADRLARLNQTAVVRSAVDSPENIDRLAQAACDTGTTIPLLVEVDVGMKRCGAPPGQPALGLARQIEQTPGVRFDGLQGYEGHVITTVEFEQRKKLTIESMASLIQTRRLIEQAGLPVSLVSGGGSGTYAITCEIEGMDEIQCGSYALMDHSYAKVTPEFHVSRWIEATVISAGNGRVVADVGVKGIGGDFGPPIVQGHPEAEVTMRSEEHLPIGNLSARVGDRLRLVPSHGCTTHHLYRKMWITRGGVVEAVWAIEGAACLE